MPCSPDCPVRDLDHVEMENSSEYGIVRCAVDSGGPVEFTSASFRIGTSSSRKPSGSTGRSGSNLSTRCGSSETLRSTLTFAVGVDVILVDVVVDMGDDEDERRAFPRIVAIAIGDVVDY